MNNILLVTSREYLSRVKKKSFILMTLLAPILITAFYGGIGLVVMNDQVGSKEKTFAIVDQSETFKDQLKESDKIKFEYYKEYEVEKLLEDNAPSGLLRVPDDYVLGEKLNLKYESLNSLSVIETDKIQDAFRKTISDSKLTKLGITQTDIDNLKSDIKLEQFELDEDLNLKSSSIGAKTAVGMAAALLIYFFIFIYGVQVMKGVIEEKTNRIVEIIISTVRPFQLMLGKVVGIALVGLTQLSIWLILTTVLMVVSSLLLGFNMMEAGQMTNLGANPAMENMDPDIQNVLASFLSLPFGKIITAFIFYFLGGYLFYGALFAAIGSAVDSETDTQQFMLPITLPLVFSMVISFSVVINDPNGALATWLSMIPFSSPIVMMARMPFNPDPTQVVFSILILLASILGVIWLAGRIYRTGILMYGKKPTYKEIGKWLFYKN